MTALHWYEIDRMDSSNSPYVVIEQADLPSGMVLIKTTTYTWQGSIMHCVVVPTWNPWDTVQRVTVERQP